MKKKGHSNSKTSQNSVMPQFKKQLERNNNRLIDFSDAPDELRLSDRIHKLIEPFMESMEITVLVDCATIAWNECILEDAEIKGSYNLNNMLLNFGKHRDLINRLKDRKRQMFKDNYRHIKEVKVYKEGDDYNINVASDIDIESVLKRMMSLAEGENDV